jgi:hypothetical protein
MTFGVTYEVKSQFFDRKAVAERVGQQTARALSRLGAFIRRRARSSMRRRKKPSAPGTPPSAHSSSKVATLKNILFAFDHSRNSVVIGPVRLNQKFYFGGPVLAAGTVPQLHEFGGTLGIREKLENLAPVVRRAKKTGTRRNLTPNQKAAMIRRKQAQGQQEYIAGTKWVRMGRRKPLPGQPTRVRWANYPPRPFMGPALQHEWPKVARPSLWVAASAGGFMGVAG